MFLLGVGLFTVAVIGQCLGGALISADLAGTQWRAIFLLNVPIGLLVIVAGLRHLPPDEHRDSRRLDLGGVSALSVALLLVIVPLVVGRGAGWPAPTPRSPSRRWAGTATSRCWWRSRWPPG